MNLATTWLLVGIVMAAAGMVGMLWRFLENRRARITGQPPRPTAKSWYGPAMLALSASAFVMAATWGSAR